MNVIARSLRSPRAGSSSIRARRRWLVAKLALAWCLRNPDVSTVITGASRPEQVVENMAALDVLPRLTNEVLERIEAVLENQPEDEPDFR